MAARVCWSAVLVLPFVLLGSSTVDADVTEARGAELRNSVGFTLTPSLAQDDTMSCFDGSQAVLVNPGCFTTSNPSQPGDCSSSSSHFFVQYLFPNVTTTRRLRGFGFLSNDGNTVFPSAGVVVLPVTNGSVRFPIASELATLQRNNITSPGDTSQVFVDLRSENILVAPGDDVAFVFALQFPEGGQLVSAGEGPGIASEAEWPDEKCDFFTVDGGTSGTWFAPTSDPSDPSSTPLDWGFVAVFEPPAVPVESMTWSHVKRLYRRP